MPATHPPIEGGSSRSKQNRLAGYRHRTRARRSRVSRSTVDILTLLKPGRPALGKDVEWRRADLCHTHQRSTAGWLVPTL